METNYKRIKSGKFLDINKKPYNVNIVDKMISYFEDNEEYEKRLNEELEVIKEKEFRS